MPSFIFRRIRIPENSGIVPAVTAADSTNSFGSLVANTKKPMLRPSRANNEDRKEFARSSDDDPHDRSLPIGAHWGIEETTSGEWTAICFGLERSNARRRGRGPVLGSVYGGWREA